MTQTEILEVLRDVIDPELGINVVDLGLVYGVEIETGHVRVAMTMTTRACPLNSYISEAAESAIRRADRPWGTSASRWYGIPPGTPR